jgi:hypothetical protein
MHTMVRTNQEVRYCNAVISNTSTHEARVCTQMKVERDVYEAVFYVRALKAAEFPDSTCNNNGAFSKWIHRFGERDI